MEKIILEPKFRERRRFPRFPIAISLNYVSLNSSRVNKTQTQDISANGIGFITREGLLLGTTLDIWLIMPDNGEQIHLKGKVAWSKLIGSNNYRVGISLEDSTLRPFPLVLRILQTKQC